MSNTQSALQDVAPERPSLGIARPNQAPRTNIVPSFSQGANSRTSEQVAYFDLDGLGSEVEVRTNAATLTLWSENQLIAELTYADLDVLNAARAWAS